MKAITKALCIAAVGCSLVWGQGPTWTTTNMDSYNGYDYELWSENNTGTVSMKLTGDNGTVANAKGGTFECTWNNTLNILFRSGKKWGMSSSTTPRSAGNISIDFAATWSSSDGARMLGVYGWAFYPPADKPTKDESGVTRTYSDQIEYYIIQDLGGYNPATGGDAPGGGKKYGEATIDGIVYEFYVADRINRWALTGNGDVTFKQYFSVPKTSSGRRTTGIISVSKHFEEWHKIGMKMMDCRLYEVAMKVESYTGGSNGNGSATVTKNILTIGGSVPSAPVQATTCKTPLVTYPTNTAPVDPYTACFKYTNDKCYVCKIDNESPENGYYCSSGWVWDGTQIDDNLEKGYWYKEVECPGTTPILSSNGLPLTAGSPLYYSLKGEPLGNIKPQKSGVYIIKEGYSVKKIVVK
jgi:hypothetical protein